MYIDKYGEQDVILVGPPLLERIYNIFITWGTPMPDRFISNNYYGKANNYLELNTYADISGKDTLKHVREYTPKSYFENEEYVIKKGLRYYIKDIYLDNGKGIEIVNSENAPSMVPKNKIIQEELVPHLINGYKYDLRVLICVCRNGDVFISENILYRIANVKYNKNELKLLGNITNTIVNENNQSFFYNDRLRSDVKTKIDRVYIEEIEKLHGLYLKELNVKIPKIYEKLLNVFNKLDNIEESFSHKHFYIHGLDFMADPDNNLHLLEINSPPGHDGKNIPIDSYHTFFDEASKFIINKNKEK